MALLELRIYDDPILRRAAEPIERITSRHRELAHDMAETMYDARGIGLAAIQVGVLERLIAIDVDWVRAEEGEKVVKKPIVMINPIVIAQSIEDDVYKEGCLSLPGIEGDVWRPLRVRVRHQRLNGETIERDCEGLLARCVLHEIDHLDGVLFIDRMAKDKRRKLAVALDRLAQSQAESR
jgi:peptide deformylase